MIIKTDNEIENGLLNRNHDHFAKFRHLVGRRIIDLWEKKTIERRHKINKLFKSDNSWDLFYTLHD